MKVAVASKSPVKESAVRKALEAIFSGISWTIECVDAKSGVSDQPMSDDEIRTGALGRIQHSRELSPDADLYIGLEGGVEEMYGELYNFGWVIAESKDDKHGYGRTVSFALPQGIKELMIHKGLEQSHATDEFFAKKGTKTGTGTIGPLTNNVITYTDWYYPAVVCALIPFLKKELY